MTFRSLYRLEQRGLIECPIVGVAVDDWTVEQLVERARESIVGTGEELDPAVFERFAARLSYVQGDFGDAATYTRVGEAIKGAETPVFYLEIPPFLFGRVVQGLADAGLTTTCAGRRGEAVRARPRVGARTRRRAPSVHRRVSALPDRPLPREDGNRGDPVSPLRKLAPRADLEPKLHRVRPDHDGRGLRSRGSRTLLRPRRSPTGRGREPPDAGRRGSGDGAARRSRSEDAQGLARLGLSFDSDRGSCALRARAVRRLPRHRGGQAGFDHRDLRCASARHRELALGRCAVLHPHREAPPRHADRAPARLQAPPATPRLPGGRGCPRRTSWSSSSIRARASG